MENTNLNGIDKLAIELFNSSFVSNDKGNIKLKGSMGEVEYKGVASSDKDGLMTIKTYKKGVTEWNLISVWIYDNETGEIIFNSLNNKGGGSNE